MKQQNKLRKTTFKWQTMLCLLLLSASSSFAQDLSKYKVTIWSEGYYDTEKRYYQEDEFGNRKYNLH